MEGMIALFACGAITSIIFYFTTRKIENDKDVQEPNLKGLGKGCLWYFIAFIIGIIITFSN